jgi:acetyl esterase/lipase
MLLKAKRGGLAMPAAVSVLYPWADITRAGDTYDTLAAVDPVLTNADLAAAAKAYVPSSIDPKNSLISPVYGSYSRDFPPTQILIGTRDMLLSDAARMQRVLRSAGVEVDLLVYEGMWHGFQSWTTMPEAERADADMAAFFRRFLK